MSLVEIIQSEHSKRMALQVADIVGNDPERFQELVELFASRETVIAQRAAYCISHCTDRFPELSGPHLLRFMKLASDDPVHVAIKRNVVRILKSAPLDEHVEGPAYDLCWNFASSAKEDIGVRVHALYVLGRIAVKYPELAPEVLGIATPLKDHDSAGIRSCSRKVVEMLKRD